jgi:hypothetical protein
MLGFVMQPLVGVMKKRDVLGVLGEFSLVRS